MKSHEQMGKRRQYDPNFRWRCAVFTLTFLISQWGLLTVYSAHDAGLQLFFRQFLHLLAALGLMAAAMRVPFRVYRRSAGYLAGFSIPVLVLVLFFGVRVNGMRGWFSLGTTFLQPSELLKPFFLLLLAVLCVRVHDDWRRFLATGGVTLVWTVPILLQPDFGTAFIYWGCFAMMFFLSGGRRRLLVLPPLAMLPAVLIYLWSKPYAVRRLTGFLDPDRDLPGSGWHIRQFQLAIARGEWFGTKIGNAHWSNSYLPFSYNDSAFASMVETLGVLGAAILLLLVVALVVTLLLLADLLPVWRPVEKMLVAGAAFAVAFQALLHIGVNTAILPPTGITLPLISYGGSSLVSTTLLLGMVLSAGRMAPGDENET